MKKLQALFCALLVCTLLLSGLPRTASAAYPDRPVTIIIPFGPGGAVDIAARILAEYFQNKHQITLNIVCKAGGAGAPAMLDVAKALSLIHISSHTGRTVCNRRVMSF